MSTTCPTPVRICRQLNSGDLSRKEGIGLDRRHRRLYDSLFPCAWSARLPQSAPGRRPHECQRPEAHALTCGLRVWMHVRLYVCMMHGCMCGCTAKCLYACACVIYMQACLHVIYCHVASTFQCTCMSTRRPCWCPLEDAFAQRRQALIVDLGKEHVNYFSTISQHKRCLRCFPVCTRQTSRIAGVGTRCPILGSMIAKTTCFCRSVTNALTVSRARRAALHCLRKVTTTDTSKERKFFFVKAEFRVPLYLPF